MEHFIDKHPLHVALLFALLLMFATASSHRAQAYNTNENPHANVVLAQATSEITETPAATETASLTEAPTPTETPSASSTALTVTPTDSPTDVPTDAPTELPTDTPTEEPTAEPTSVPSPLFTDEPTAAPTETATDLFTETPTATETVAVTETPFASETPTVFPTETETPLPTQTSTLAPTESPTPLPADENEIIVEPDANAELRAENDAVLVEIPANAVKRRAVVKFQRLDAPHDDPSGRVVRNTFSLKAHVANNPDKAIIQFERALTLSLRYDENALGGWRADDLQIVYWDETLARWMSLPSRVDTKQQIITAETDHFTDFGVANAPDLQNYLPNLEGFQTDLFTGGAGYSFPLQLPPGQGGLSPRLGLSYSSTGVDMFASSAQASYVGAGWSLDTSYIGRDTRNSYTKDDDVFSIVLNGASYDLVEGADGKWHTSKEQFWRITRQFNGSPSDEAWTILTNDGTKYEFGISPNSRAIEWRGDTYGNWAQDIYQWFLEKVTDTHGNVIEYTYKHETSASCAQGTVDLAVYPKNIKYNRDGLGGYLSRVEFNYSDRNDYNLYQPARQCGPAPYQKSKLDRVDVKTTDNGVMQLVRAYEFDLKYNLFTGVYNDHGDGTGFYGKLMLKKIIVHGSDDVTTLPATVFTYENNRLKTGENGIGGTVTFTYEPTPVAVAHYGDKYEQDYVQMYNDNPCLPFCSPPPYSFWFPSSGAQLYLASGGLRYTPASGPANPHLEWWLDPHVPGAFYTITQTVKANVANIQARLKLYDATGFGSETNLTNWITLPNGSNYDIVTTFYLPDSIKRPQIRFYAQGGGGSNNYVFIRKTKLQPQNTRHRVATKTVDDGMGGVNNWNYAYQNPAVNDAAHSQAVASGIPRHAAGSQFRGHTNVTVTDPLGNHTENHYFQNDLYSGKADWIVQRDGSGNKYVETLNTYNFVNYPIAAGFPILTDRIDFIKLDETRTRTYDGNNVAAPKERKTQYLYDAYGNVNESKAFTDTGAFYRKTCRFFNPNVSANIVNKVARLITLNADTNCTTTTPISDTRFVYDNQPDFAYFPLKGDVTKTIVYADVSTAIESAEYTYDSWGNVTDIKDAFDHNTHTTYDGTYHIFATQIDPPLAPVTNNTYKFLYGALETTTDANTAVTSTTFDVFGRRKTIKAPLEQTSNDPTADYDYTLGSAGNPTKVRVRVRKDLGTGNPAQYQEAWWFYDGMGRLIQKQAQAATSGQIILANTAYDQRGQVKWVSLPYAVTANIGTFIAPDWNKPKSFTEYDALGRVKKATSPDATFSTMTYDHWLTTTTDANGNYKDYLSDAFGRTTRVREYESNALYATTQYTYNALDQLTQTQDNANNLTTLTYDWLGRKTSMSDPDMGYWTYGYDNGSNLVRQTDARNNSVCFVYDELNRVTTKTARTGTDCNAPIAYTTTYGYDAYNGSTQFGRGRRTSLGDSFGNNQTWTYDKQGRVSSTSQTIAGAPANPYNTSFTYDAMSRARTMTYPDVPAETVTVTYNNQGLAQSLNGANNYITDASYTAASQIDLLTFGNTATTDYIYNAQNLRLTDIVTIKSGSPAMLNLHYTFDNVGNILSAQDNIGTAGTTNYSYDDLNRLLSASVTNGANQYSRSWTYTPIGNMQTRVEQGNTTTYSYDTNHKHAVAQAGSNYFCYDNNGNMTRRNATSSACTNGDQMSYDVENRMTSMTTASGTTSFAYSGDGVRVLREVVGVGTTYYIGSHFEVYKPNGSSATTNKYYYFGSQRVAARINGTLFYMQGDHLGSSSLVMTLSGTLNTRQTYFPYGAKRTTEGSPLPTDYTFTGQKSDDSTGLMFYNARYYDAGLGRFTQADTIVPNPSDPQSLNRYSYVRNNPVNLVDPTGHEDCAPEDDWCWQNRWFEAHGYCWAPNANGGEGDWTTQCNPEFQDEAVMDEVIAEAEISLLGEDWGEDQKEAVARGVAMFGRALSGGVSRLKELLGRTVIFLGASPIFCQFGQNPCSPPSLRMLTHEVFLPKQVFANFGENMHMIVVHELGHVVDWESQITLDAEGHFSGRFSDVWSGQAFTTYSGTSPFSHWERFADAVGVFVFRQDYSKVITMNRVSDFEDQMNRMQALLEGWY